MMVKKTCSRVWCLVVSCFFLWLALNPRGCLGDDIINCVVAGPCVDCSITEKFEKYCEETGKRQELACKLNETQGDIQENGIKLEMEKVHIVDGSHLGKLQNSKVVQEFKSCRRTEADEVTYVFRFLFLMLFIGGVSFWGVLKQKSKHESLYERRLKSKKASSSFLG